MTSTKMIPPNEMYALVWNSEKISTLTCFMYVPRIGRTVLEQRRYHEANEPLQENSESI